MQSLKTYIKQNGELPEPVFKIPVKKPGSECWLATCCLPGSIIKDCETGDLQLDKAMDYAASLMLAWLGDMVNNPMLLPDGTWWIGPYGLRVPKDVKSVVAEGGVGTLNRDGTCLSVNPMLAATTGVVEVVDMTYQSIDVGGAVTPMKLAPCDHVLRISRKEYLLRYAEKKEDGFWWYRNKLSS